MEFFEEEKIVNLFSIIYNLFSNVTFDEEDLFFFQEKNKS